MERAPPERPGGSPSKENTNVPQLAGQKRKAEGPALLPAIDFLASSPSSRPSKRQTRLSSLNPTSQESGQTYPTPIPSSSGILPSSPPLLSNSRPTLLRTLSTASERAPLSAVACVPLDEDGKVLRMGRSSNSSDYQLSANRLISRVHVEARFIPASGLTGVNMLQVVCTGWNGITVHSEGKKWQLAKHDSFTSETEGAEVMIDVQDARVIVGWPKRANSSAALLESLDEESPSRGRGSDQSLPSGRPSYDRRPYRLQSPVSPSPMTAPTSMTLLGTDPPAQELTIKVYEDEENRSPVDQMHDEIENTQASSKPSQPLSVFSQVPPDGTPLSCVPSAEFSDQDEENDPIIVAFGPQGENLVPRMASLGNSKASPKRGREMKRPSEPKRRSDSESTNEADNTALVNHVVNQLAFSRLASTPISTILNQLPAELKGEDSTMPENKGLTNEQLKSILDSTQCIGEISREGKDAAGKKLESEYYYLPASDTDEKRREAVVQGLQKPGLRACRKQHKQYFWRKPK